MRLNINPVLNSIEGHRAAVAADEASFNSAGVPVDVKAAERTGWAEREAFVAFVRTPCATAEDAHAKLRHLLDGTIGERDTHLDCLIDYGDTLLQEFLRSLIVDQGQQA